MFEQCQLLEIVILKFNSPALLNQLCKICLVLRLYFTVYPSSRFNTYMVYSLGRILNVCVLGNTLLSEGNTKKINFQYTTFKNYKLYQICAPLGF